ncbi:MAG: group 1 glycosyl transferase, partial [Halothiobacillaceae bacterium]
MLPRGVTQALSKKVGIEKRYLNIVHTESSCGWGGQEMRILSEAAGLLERGHQVSLLVPEEAPIYEQARRRNIPVTMVNWLRHHQPDIINTHSSTDSWLVALANTLLGADVPIVRTRHVSVAVARKLSNRWLYGRSVTKVVTTGESLRAELIKQLDLLPNHVVSIPSGVDLDHFNRATSCNVSSLRESIGLPAGGKVIGIVATIR